MGGVLFLLLAGIPPRRAEHMEARASIGSHVKDLVLVFWPILFTAVLYVKLHVRRRSHPACDRGIAAAPSREPAALAGDFQGCPRGRHRAAVVRALWFKLNLEAGGAVEAVVAFFQDIHMPRLLVVFLLPFLVSFSTG